MYICLCKGVTDKQLHDAARQGLRNLRSACRQLGVGSECGQCKPQLQEVLQSARLDEGSSLTCNA